MVDTTAFDQIRIGIASPEEVRKWSRGEVKKPETINYRTFKPEPDGLFCERIFGPTRDWECHCGKYRKIKFRGITCDRCGVEVTRSNVRREHMGHIELAAPVMHIWYLKSVPSPVSLLLDISPRPLENVVYFARYIVTEVGHEEVKKRAEQLKRLVEEEKLQLDQEKEELLASLRERARQQKDSAEVAKALEERVKQEQKTVEEKQAALDAGLRLLLGAKLDGEGGLTKRQLLSESEHQALRSVADLLKASGKAPARPLFKAGLGAEAIAELLAEIDLEEMARELRQEIKETTGPRRARSIKRLDVVESFRKSRNRPEWMVWDVVPIIPPELRPMVQLDGGRFATSDLNDLYRRIINRNNRLKKIKELNAPESIVNHEKRLLQEAVDALIDNGRRARPVTGSNNRPLKSLSDMLKGKEGRFRKNLLGKRVDYSGRSVIVVGPHLKLNQCGIPREMALELFKPFVMKRLVEKGLSTNVKHAKKMVDRQHEGVWEALEEVISDHPVMLNRAPTLHRLGIQAFEPVLVEGKAIQIHPLVCYPFNADFDGDQMAAHVPLSAAAQAEARILMLSSENIFSPAHGKPLVTPTRDMVLGLYYLTQKRSEPQKQVRTFSSPDEVVMGHEHGAVHLQEEIRVRWNGQLITTTPGRVVFNQILPPMLQFYDRVITHKEMGRLVSECHEHYGLSRAVRLLDDLKELGFRYATISGLTISITDMDIPEARREQILAETEQAVTGVNQSYDEGLISTGEREDQIFRLWTQATEQMGAAIMEHIDPFNPIFMMANSGARGTIRQVTQLCGMRGLMTDPFGKFIEDLPVKSNFHEGLSVLEYFVSTHGARKGLADTALRTADAGYLTRRLVDVAQDVIVREQDCGTTSGITVEAIREGTEEIEALSERIEGRVAATDIVEPRSGKLILRAGEEIGRATPPPCPACEGKMYKLWRCESCGMELTQDELVTQAGAIFELSEDEDAKEPSDEVVEQLADRGRMLEEGLCPGCSIPFLRLYECEECDARVSSTEVPSPLETIERVSRECLDFLSKVRAVKPGAPALQTIADPFTGKVLVEARTAVAPDAHSKLMSLARKLDGAGGLARGQVTIRSPLTCAMRQGICALCYGRDLSSGRIVEVGEAVGIIGAQSIGEPGTQLTMRTFHTGGVAAQYLTQVAEVKKKRQETLREIHEDIRRGLVAFEEEMAERERTRKVQQMLKVLEEQVKGLLRVVELFEARRPKGEAIVTEVDGVVHDIETRGVKTLIIHAEQDIEDDGVIGQVTSETVRHPKKNTVLAEADKEITPQVRERLRDAGVKKVKIARKYMVPYRGYLEVKPGDVLKQGDRLTEGPLDPQKVLKMRGLGGAQEYLLREIQKVYKSQGVDINDKHLEVIIRQMLKKRRIIEPGDTECLLGQMVDRGKFEDTNRRIAEQGGQEATAEPVLLGITEASLSTESFLSAASFQKTTKVLTEAAIKGKIDHLIGLKENVIIGRLIPAGTGMQQYRELQIEGPAEEPPLLPLPREEHEEDALLRAIGRGAPGDIGPISASEAEEAARGEDKGDTAI